ncbi:SGTB family protein [Megaselia abdita]
MTDQVVKSFVKSFVGFLKKQCDDRKLNSDQMESVEVAIQCLESAYEVENTSNDEATSSTENAAMSQIDIFDVYQTMFLEKTPENKELAEEIKNEGNRLMKENKYYEALQNYNRAIVHDPRNPVLYCNRAAAFTRLGDHEKAVSDCKLALVYNPNYGKAYGRMGIAYSNLSKFDLAKTAYQKAIELEPDNQDYANNLMVAEQKIAQGSVGVGAAPGGPAAGGNLNNILLESLNNPAIGTFIRDMMQDPMVTSALQSFASNPEAMMNVSRQFADQLNNASPDLLNSLRGVMGGNLPPNFPGGNNPPGSGNNPQQPPPSS